MTGAAYALHGTTLGFDRPQALLAGAETDDGPVIAVRLVDPRALSAPAHGWSPRWAATEDESGLSEASEPDGRWLRFHRAFDARWDGAELVVRVRAAKRVVLRGVLDLVVPMLRVDAGAIALHAAAFVGPGGATLVLGDNGAGKSTLTGLAAGLGRAVLADDCVVLDVRGPRPSACRGVPMLGLSRGTAAALDLTGRARSGDDKVDVPLQPLGLAPPATVLERIVLLGTRSSGPEIEQEAVGGTAALAAIAHQCHGGLVGPGPGALLDRLGALVDGVTVLHARVPEGLAEARAALERSGW